MLGVKNNRTHIKGKFAKKLKAKLNKIVVSKDEDYVEKLTQDIINKVDRVLNENGEITNAVITSEYDNKSEILNLEMSYKLHKPIDKIDVQTIPIPEGMTAKQYEIMCKQILKDAQENNVHDFELTT